MPKLMLHATILLVVVGFFAISTGYFGRVFINYTMQVRCLPELNIPIREEFIIRTEQTDIGLITHWLRFNNNYDFPIYLHILAVSSPLINPKNMEVLLIDEKYKEFMIQAPYVDIEYSASFVFFEKLINLNSAGKYPVLGDSKIVQAPESTSLFDLFDHKTHDPKYGQEQAIDIKASLGTTVLAFQGGTVVEIEDQYNDVGCRLDYMLSRGNEIKVLQDDGFQTLYGHLLKGSIQVEVGDRIEEGQEIAKVGNSGYSKNPHLHIEVGGHTVDGYKTIPIKFYTKNKERTWVPKKGQNVINIGPIKINNITKYENL